MTGKHRLGCFGARDQGRCDNRLTIRRDEVEARVLKALQEKLLNQELFEEFCDEFTCEMSRLRMERRASLSSAKREVERIGVRVKKLLNLLLDDEIAVDEGKAEIKALDARRKELQAQLETADEPSPLLPPEMAALFRQKVTTLAQALQHPETRVEATEALRGLIDTIVMTPDEGALKIELKGNLAAMLGATVQSKRSPETGDLLLQVSMVAGACNAPKPPPWFCRFGIVSLARWRHEPKFRTWVRFPSPAPETRSQYLYWPNPLQNWPETPRAWTRLDAVLLQNGAVGRGVSRRISRSRFPNFCLSVATWKVTVALILRAT